MSAHLEVPTTAGTSPAPAPALDRERKEAFAGRMLQVVNDAMLALQISVGYHTGLFDTLAGLPPATSAEIAGTTGLNERYVREWLGTMVVGRIIEYDPRRAAYRLPAEHAAWLTRAAGPDNLSVLATAVPLWGGVEQQVVECFRLGGGVPYAAYPRFTQTQAEFSGPFVDATLLHKTLPLVPGLMEQLREGIEVLEIGCGSGHATNLMARSFPASRFTGYDILDDGIAAARAEAQRLGLRNARFEVQNVAALLEPGRYQLIVAIDVIHDLAQPRAVLRNIAAALSPGGRFLMVDIAASSRLEENLDHPLGAFFYATSTFHCMTVSLAQGGEGLGTMWGEQKALELLAEAGFTSVDVRRVEGDPINNYYIARLDGQHGAGGPLA